MNFPQNWIVFLQGAVEWLFHVNSGIISALNFSQINTEATVFKDLNPKEFDKVKMGNSKEWIPHKHFFILSLFLTLRTGLWGFTVTAFKI